MLYKFELNYNTGESTKNICCSKGEGTVDHSRVTRWLKKFCLGYKNFGYQARSDRPKSVDSGAMLQTIEANLVCSTQRVSGKLKILLS